MSRFTIRSFASVGPLRFGMTKKELSRELTGEVREFRKTTDSTTLSDQFLDVDIIAHYESGDRLEAVEFYGKVLPEWNGIALLGRTAKAILEDVKKHSSAAEIDNDGAIFHDLGFGFYSPGWLAGDDNVIESAIAFKKSYYPQVRVSDDRYNLQRFLDAQNPVYDRVWDELKRGRKQSHWMWFIFPQITGLGHSPMAQRYAISSLDEAKAYLDHSVLGARLRECTRLICKVDGKSAHDILGSPDDMKFHSCTTLFARAAPQEKIFLDALEKYFGGAEDQATVARLR